MIDKTGKEKYKRASINIHVQAENVNKTVIELVIRRMSTHVRHQYVSLMDISPDRFIAVPSTGFTPSLNCSISLVIWTKDKFGYCSRGREITSLIVASLYTLRPKCASTSE